MLKPCLRLKRKLTNLLSVISYQLSGVQTLAGVQTLVWQEPKF